MTAAVFDQAAFRARNDDGSETLATWKQPLNTNWTQPVDENFRVRFLIQETAAGMGPNAQIQLQYNHELAGWINANDLSSVVRSSTSIHFTDGDTTSQQLGSGTFIEPNGGMDDANGVAGEGNEIDFLGNDEVEVEYCCQIRSADVADTDTVQLRVLVDGNLPTQTNVPSITVSETVTETGTADLEVQPADLATQGEQPHEGTASLDALSPSMTASAYMRPEGVGVLDAAATTLTASSEVPAEATASLEVQVVDLTTQGETPYAGVGSAQVADAVLSAQGQSILEGLADLAAAAATLATAGAQSGIPIGTADLAVQAVILTVAGERDPWVPTSAGSSAWTPVTAASGDWSKI